MNPSSPHVRGPQEATPWRFVPSLYFLQAVPNIIVTATFLSVYKDLGIDNLKTTFWTSILALPWTFKMFWGPFIDLHSTKRRWTLATQLVILLALVLTAVAMRLPWYFPATLAILSLVAILSATHDIACDGLYLLALSSQQQAAYVGIMAVAARLGWMFSLFGVLFLAGKLTGRGWSHAAAWSAALAVVAVAYGVGFLWNILALPRPPGDAPVAEPAPGEGRRNTARTLAVIAAGVCAYFLLSSALQLLGHSIHKYAHRESILRISA